MSVQDFWAYGGMNSSESSLVVSRGRMFCEEDKWEVYVEFGFHKKGHVESTCSILSGACLEVCVCLTAMVRPLILVYKIPPTVFSFFQDVLSSQFHTFSYYCVSGELMGYFTDPQTIHNLVKMTTT